MKISVLSTCNKFWKRFGVTRKFWEKSLIDSLKVDFLLATVDEDILEIGHPFQIFKFSHEEALKKDGHCESKPWLLRHLLMRIDKSTSHILFTDVDVVFPTDIFRTIEKDLSKKSIFYGISDRIDANEKQTLEIMETKSLTHEIVSQKPNPKKRGMGWFQLIEKDLFFSKIPSLNWMHNGYDLFDWELNKLLSNQTQPHVFQFSHPAIHLYHGNPGSTWNGTSIDL